jgi:hypothetical protein
MKCLPGWPSVLWIWQELWLEMKLKEMCAYDSDESRDGERARTWGEKKQTDIAVPLELP